MFNASYFTYDGVYSGEYGLRIADFDDSMVITTDVFTVEPVVSKPARLDRFYYAGSKFETQPSLQYTILSERPIHDSFRREIIAWLLGRGEYKDLIVDQPDLQDYTYRCIFTALNIVYVRGYCHGFTVTATFDSPYAYGPTQKLNLTSSGTATSVNFINNSDILDKYIYPKVTFRASSSVGGNAISITNRTDSTSRVFRFSSLASNEQITVDNELKIITSSTGNERLSSFNKNWLRLRPGTNSLSITINGSVTIECPTYILIGY